MKLFGKTFILSLTIGLFISAAFLAGYLFRDHQVSPNDLPVLLEARKLLLQYGYHSPPPDPSLEYGMIRGMLQAYNDPFTSFSEPAQHELTSNNLAGKFGGIGVQIQRDSQSYPVLIPIPKSPAVEAGILEGDRLIQVDDLSISKDTPEDVIQAALRGKTGTFVQVVIQRPPEYQTYTFRVKRAEYILPSVNGYLSPIDRRLGIVKINLMAASTPEEIIETIQDLQKHGATAIALDLRDNFGGLLSSGVEVARLFLKQGVILKEQYKDQEPKVYSVEKLGIFADLPMVIFINHNTASAAEIVAGALQAHKRAILIGSPTYGKDTVQMVFELRDGSSLQVTAARWWIPAKENDDPPATTGVGLQPDVPLPDAVDQGIDPAISPAIEHLFGALH